MIRVRFYLLLLALGTHQIILAQSSGRVAGVETTIPGYDPGVHGISLARAMWPELDGDGLSVSIKEEAFDSSDIDFRGRILSSGLEADFTSTHATQMATIVAGAGNLHRSSLGLAPAAYLSGSDFGTLLPDTDQDYRRLGISVQNHSYGVGVESHYGLDAAAYDASVRALPPLLHVFSAGNAGQAAAEEGPYTGLPGWANLTGSFKMAKNVLVVGALDAPGAVAERSSRGPAHDGRIKPDLVAYGGGGTSEGAALVSGMALLLQQAYQDKYRELPDAAMVRALLIAGADDRDEPGPSYVSGYGEPNLPRSLALLESGNIANGSLDPGEVIRFPLTVTARDQLLSIALAWDDPPAEANALRALVNDLDLRLRRLSDGAVLLPWTLSSAAQPDSLSRPARPGRDSLNNVELIRWQGLLSGTYEIVVDASHATEAQAFALAFDKRPFLSFQCTYPAPDQFLPTGDSLFLYWNTDLMGTTSVAYSLNSGESWAPIAEDIPLEDGRLPWTPPDTLSQALLRWQSPHGTYYSRTFWLSPIPELSVTLVCDDSLGLQWTAMPGASSYVLYQLGERRLEPFLTVADTQLVIPYAVFRARHLAVAPASENGPAGLRSFTLDYTRQGVKCYYRTFLARRLADNTVSLQLELSTANGLAEVTFEKWQDGAFQPFFSSDIPASLLVEAEDPQPRDGQNLYRARIDRIGGDPNYTDPREVLFAAGQPLVLFPNPQSRGRPLQLVVSDYSSDRELRLFNGLGQLVLAYPLDRPQDELFLAPYPAGLYHFAVYENGRIVQQGKLLLY